MQPAEQQRQQGQTAMLDSIYVPEWQQISKTFILNDIVRFAGSVSRFGEEYSLPDFTCWAEGLLQASHNADYRDIARLLNGFPAMVLTVKENIGIETK